MRNQNSELELKMLEELMANMDSRMAGRAMPQPGARMGGGQMSEREMMVMGGGKPSQADMAGMGDDDEMTRRLRAAMGQ